MREIILPITLKDLRNSSSSTEGGMKFTKMFESYAFFIASAMGSTWFLLFWYCMFCCLLMCWVTISTDPLWVVFLFI